MVMLSIHCSFHGKRGLFTPLGKTRGVFGTDNRLAQCSEHLLPFRSCHRDIWSTSVQCSTLRSGIRDHCCIPQQGICALVIGHQLELVGALVALFDIEIQIGRTGKLHVVWWNNWKAVCSGALITAFLKAGSPSCR